MFSVSVAVTVAATSVLITEATPPLALHQLIVVPPGGDAVLRLSGYDLDGDDMTAAVAVLPTTDGSHARAGELYQLSQVYSSYGYEPKKGATVTPGAAVTGSENRVYYTRPAIDAPPVGAWAVLNYTVSDLPPDVHTPSSTSQPGMVTLVPPSGVLVGSAFARGSEGWVIVGNKAPSSPATYEASSRGQMNHYVYGSDDAIHTDNRPTTTDQAQWDVYAAQRRGRSDRSLWYFQAPGKFNGHHGIAYGGVLTFTLSSFYGDFGVGNLNTGGPGTTPLSLVELHCAKCDLNKGVTLAYPVSAAPAFDGSTTKFEISLKEKSGWLQDPKNTIIAWSPPSQCTFIEVLSGLSSVRILGDWTAGTESVALDTVLFQNTKAQVPICAQGTPDASTCTCQ